MNLPTTTSRGFFVTGTDTGVGKTLVACALLHAFAARGVRAVGMKPVAAGATRAAGALRNEDVELLAAAGSVAAPPELRNPYCFEPPIAPHIAAAEARTTIDLDRIARAHHELAGLAEMVIVEGAGGFAVPLNDGEDAGDLAQRLGLPVVLVVGMRLGCLNHALLSAAVIRARGLGFAGWVANHIDPRMERPEQNIAALTQRLPAPLIGRIPFSATPRWDHAASALDVERLCATG